jgi:predicted RNA-binding protein
MLNIHLPKNGEMNIDEIKLNNGFVRPEINLNIDERIKNKLNTAKIDINTNIEDPTKKITNVLNLKVPEVNVEAQIPSNEINMGTKYEGIIFGKDKNSKGYSLQGMIMGDKNYKPKIGITNPDLNIKGGEININEGIDLESKIKGPNISGNLPNTELDINNANNLELGNKEIKINPLDINIQGKLPEGDLNIPTKDFKANIGIKDNDLNVQNPDINLKINSNIPNPELDLNGKTCGCIDGNIKIPELNNPSINIEGNVPELKMPEHDVNLKGKIVGELNGLKNKIDLDKQDIELKGSKNLEINGEIPKVDLNGNIIL